MDTSDPLIVFDQNGVCNHCKRYDEQKTVRQFSGEQAKASLASIVEKIKKSGQGKEYDCIIGVSGGVDSTYVAYLVKQLGLRALAVHFDNGWNSELSVSNIEKVLKKLDIDLHTYVIDWDEFKDLQISFLKASTPDGEIPTDHAINALLFREANQRGVRYIINGMNFATESLAVADWAYGHSDWKYIKSVHQKFSRNKLKNYPHYSIWNLFYWTFIKKIKVVSILNYVPYLRKDVMKVLEQDLGWKYYGGKHFESIYTRFYQSYFLVKKFGFNKKRGHLSDLINSGQITREAALEKFDEVDYPEQMVAEDKEFVIKKLGITTSEFDQIMKSPPKSFRDYPNIAEQIKKIKKIVNFLRQKGWYSK